MLRELLAMGIKLMVFSNKDDSDTRAVVKHFLPDIPL